MCWQLCTIRLCVHVHNSYTTLYDTVYYVSRSLSIKGALSVNVDSSSPTSLAISWILNDLTATSYTISYSNINTQCFTDSNEVITGITESIYTLTDLQEATEYSITVTAILSDGNTEIGSLTSTTMDAGKSGNTHLFVIMTLYYTVPSAAPTSVSASATSSSITVHWGPVDCIHHNGDITGYSVRYRVQGNGSTLTMSVPGGTVTEASLPIVASSTTYSIEVAAVNSAGIGVYCDPITASEQ